jgi:UDP-N-acetylglucosamine--N-acetylmuramyl-(pentapeptide) pyrophosphoryl-undecaprenol N-acetylglucosamine transferase
MTVYLFAGGGTAGHVNPMLATADALRRSAPASEVVVVGTAEGLESRLVPERGFELVTVAKVPFPRSLSLSALVFPFRFVAAALSLVGLIRRRRVSVVVGFGGYAAAPAYLAARITGAPLVIHEANAVPGIANKWASRFASRVGIAFASTPLSGGQLVGMPMNASIARLDRAAQRDTAYKFFDLDPKRPVLFVTGGSTGANRLNSTVSDSIDEILARGWQVLHTVGESRTFVDPNRAGYRVMRYCDRMDLAYALADCVIARSGAATVSELTGLGIPTIFVPYPVGNGEQFRNAADVTAAGGAIVCRDEDFTAAFVAETVIPLLADNAKRQSMASAALGLGIRDGAERMVGLISSALGGRATKGES